MKIYTRKGDDGTTGLLFGGRVRKNDPAPEAYGADAEFVVPGQNRLSALLDVARTAVRKAERRALVAAAAGSHVVPYLNRLSDLLWTMARWQEGQFMPARER